MRISDWSSDVCSSDLEDGAGFHVLHVVVGAGATHAGVEGHRRNRNLAADVERGFGVVAHQHRGRLQDLDVGHFVERTEHRRRISAEKGPAQSATAASRGGKYAAGHRATGGPAHGAGQTCPGTGALEVTFDTV